MKKYIFLLISFFGLPFISLAAGLGDLIDTGFNIITTVLIPLAFALCLLFFFWGVAKYIKDGASSDKAAADGKRIMVLGIIGLFVASSIWGIVVFIRRELQIPDVTNVEKPVIDVTGSSIEYTGVEGGP